MTTHDDLILKGEGRPAAPLSRAHAAAVLRLGVSVEQDGATGARAAGLEDRERGSIAPNAPFAGDTRRAAAAGGITVAMLVAAGIGIPDSGQIAPIGGATGGSVEGRPGSTAVRSAIDASDDRRQEQDPMKSPGVRAAVMAGVVMVASSAGAQQMPAVQWRVDDGGNGHWYQTLVAAVGMNAAQASALAASRGAKLFEGCGVELDWAYINAGASSNSAWRSVTPFQHHGPYIGLIKFDGAFAWPSGENCAFDRWDSSEPTNNSIETSVMFFAFGTPPGSRCHDVVPESISNSVLVEWDTDCNSDGIVDYGQCRDGSLPDFDGDNVPDCCERGELCKPGSQPTQWRLEDGGNGHWYRFIPDTTISWSSSRDLSMMLGGDLATITSASEQEFLFAMVEAASGGWSGGWWGPFIGATRRDLPNWQWVSGEPWDYQRWGPGEPNNDSGGSGPEDRLTLLNAGAGGSWNDVTELACAGSSCEYRTSSGFVIEWSADCNSDGIVDYGQILAGDLADANSNGIPDVCEVPSCIDADLNPNGIVDGADLGAMLAFWGPVSPAFPRADINGDGNVNGADLGILLSLWGPCGG